MPLIGIDPGLQRMVLCPPPRPCLGVYCVYYPLGSSPYQAPPARTCMNGCCTYRDGMWHHGPTTWLNFCPRTGEHLQEVEEGEL